jgi:transcriptional regulator
MYIPALFKHENQVEILEIIGKYPFATVISGGENPYVSHLPIVVDSGKKDLVLLGHLARGNPHWKLLKDSKVTVIFHGPNTYITPKWYAENNVPTWNYAVVHVTGRAELIEDQEGIVDCLKKLTAQMEASASDPWEFWIPEDLSNLSAAIVGFRVVDCKIEAKFKLSQNRSNEDYQGVLRGLGARGDEMSREVLRLMEKRN